MPVERWVEINRLTSDPAVWRAQVDQVDKLSLLDPALKEKLLSLAVTGDRQGASPSGELDSLPGLTLNLPRFVRNLRYVWR